MSHPAQPSFVWQLYHYDLEPNASLFAVKKASETVHVQLDEANGAIEVVNNKPDALSHVSVRASVYGSDGKVNGGEYLCGGGGPGQHYDEGCADRSRCAGFAAVFY